MLVRMPIVTPGEILKKEFMEPLGLDVQNLAQEMGIPSETLLGILNGRDGITAQVAECLAGKFQNSSQFWLNLQKNYENRLDKFTSPAKRASNPGLLHPEP